MENNKLQKKYVETYTEDMVKAIENDKGGLIKKIIHEEEMNEALKKNLSPKSKKNKLFMLLSFTLIFLAVFVLILYIFFYDDINTAPVDYVPASIIFIDQTAFQPIDGLNKDKIAEVVSNKAKNTKVKSGGVESIYLTENKKVIGFKRFLEMTKSNYMLENIGFFGDNFLLGTVNKEKKSSPEDDGLFLLLKIRSFTDVFPIMKESETQLLNNMHGFFNVNVSPATNYLFTKDWQDGIIGNKNARILRNEAGDIVLMYVFINDSYVVVTNSEGASEEIILRLFSSQIKK